MYVEGVVLIPPCLSKVIIIYTILCDFKQYLLRFISIQVIFLETSGVLMLVGHSL